MKQIFLSLIVLIFIACERPAGEGGTSTISGKVRVSVYDELGVYEGSYMAQGERVYIFYGNDSVPGDDVRTSDQGIFRFDYLTPGAYTLMTYSEFRTCLSGDTAVKVSVQIDEYEQDVQVPEILILDYER
jgi:hypothetical protein